MKRESEPKGFQVPELEAKEELALMAEMADKLERACNMEIPRGKLDTPMPIIRDAALIRRVLVSTIFRDENFHDWAFDLAAPAFIKRHKGTPEAESLREVFNRAQHILKKLNTVEKRTQQLEEEEKRSAYKRRLNTPKS